jgi:hypothetical protein
MSIPFVFRVREIGPTPRVLARRLPEIQRANWEDTGQSWHREMLPKHFTRAGATEYGYKPRQGERGGETDRGFRRSYTGRKLKVMNHTRPLVWSGEAQRLTRLRDVRATSKGAKIVLHANKLNWRGPHTDINMADEVRRISAGEAVTLTRQFDERLGQRLNALNDVETTEIK